MAPKVNNSTISKIIAESIGKGHVEIINRLSQPKYDEDIAEELGLKATVVRTLLNNLHSEGLVEYERIKNKSTGWYTYIWKKREEKLNDYARIYLEEKLHRLNQELEKEKEGVFRCSCSTVSLGEALEDDFFCSECGERFMGYDNSKVVTELITEIEKIKSWYDKL